MIHLGAIQISAQLASLVVYRLLACWFGVPWLRQLGRAEALIVIAAIGIRRKVLEPLWGLAAGTTWLLLNFYVTLIMVSLPVLVWQLWTRRTEPLVRSPRERQEPGWKLAGCSRYLKLR